MFAQALLPSVMGLFAEGLTRMVMRVSALMIKPYFRILFISVGLFMIAASAISAADLPPVSTAPTPIAAGYSSDELIDKITNAVTTAVGNIGTSSSLNAIGTTITGFFIVALTVWGLLKTMATGRGFGDFIGEMIPIMMSFAVVYLFTQKDAATLLVAMMGTIGSAVTGTTVDMNNYGGAVKTVLEPTFKTIANSMNMPSVTAGLQSDGVWDFIGNNLAAIAALIVAIPMKLVSLVLILIASVVMLASVTMGYISLKLALGFAPIIVPFLMFKPLSWLFDGWLKFLLGACMLFIVTVFFQQIAGALQGGMVGLSETILKETEGTGAASALDALRMDVVLYSMMCLFALLSAMLMAAAPSIASGLISGGSGSIGFGGLKGMSMSTSSKAFDKSAAGGKSAFKSADSAQVGYRQARAGAAADGLNKSATKRNGAESAAYNLGRWAGK